MKDLLMSPHDLILLVNNWINILKECTHSSQGLDFLYCKEKKQNKKKPVVVMSQLILRWL